MSATATVQPREGIGVADLPPDKRGAIDRKLRALIHELATSSESPCSLIAKKVEALSPFSTFAHTLRAIDQPEIELALVTLNAIQVDRSSPTMDSSCAELASILRHDLKKELLIRKEVKRLMDGGGIKERLGSPFRLIRLLILEKLQAPLGSIPIWDRYAQLSFLAARLHKVDPGTLLNQRVPADFLMNRLATETQLDRLLEDWIFDESHLPSRASPGGRRPHFTEHWERSFAEFTTNAVVQYVREMAPDKLPPPSDEAACRRTATTLLSLALFTDPDLLAALATADIDYHVADGTSMVRLLAKKSGGLPKSAQTTIAQIAAPPWTREQSTRLAVHLRDQLQLLDGLLTAPAIRAFGWGPLRDSKPRPTTVQKISRIMTGGVPKWHKLVINGKEISPEIRGEENCFRQILEASQLLVTGDSPPLERQVTTFTEATANERAKRIKPEALQSHYRALQKNVPAYPILCWLSFGHTSVHYDRLVTEIASSLFGKEEKVWAERLKSATRSYRLQSCGAGVRVTELNHFKRVEGSSRQVRDYFAVRFVTMVDLDGTPLHYEIEIPKGSIDPLP